MSHIVTTEMPKMAGKLAEGNLEKRQLLDRMDTITDNDNNYPKAICRH